MELKLHADAAAAPQTRARGERGESRSPCSPANSASARLTIRRRKAGDRVADRSHTPKRLSIGLSPLEERRACGLRTGQTPPLDGIL